MIQAVSRWLTSTLWPSRWHEEWMPKRNSYVHSFFLFFSFSFSCFGEYRLSSSDFASFSPPNRFIWLHYSLRCSYCLCWFGSIQEAKENATYTANGLKHGESDVSCSFLWAVQSSAGILAATCADLLWSMRGGTSWASAGSIQWDFAPQLELSQWSGS